RRPAPPPGWYLPDLARRRGELDSFDVVEGLVLADGPRVEVLNGVSLHGGLVVSWPQAAALTAKGVVNDLIEHWRAWGLPDYAQFDNDTLFHGPSRYADTVGRGIRLCLSLGGVPGFVPPRETGFKAAIEGYNGWWQAKVGSRFHHADLEQLQGRSNRFVDAYRRRRAARIEAAPGRRTFPVAWRLNLQAPLCGRLVYLRRTDGRGRADVLGHSFAVSPQWPGRLVRAEVDLSRGRIRFYALRRRAPTDQPLLAEVAYQLPQRRFQEGPGCTVTCHHATVCLTGMYCHLPDDAITGIPTGVIQGSINIYNGYVISGRQVGQFVRITDITDGTSNTLLVGEWTPTQAASGELIYNATAWLPAFDVSGGYARGVCLDIGPAYFGPPIPPSLNGPGYGSFHPGGANFLFADGSVHLLSYSLTQQLPDGSKSIIEALATYAGGEVVDGSNY